MELDALREQVKARAHGRCEWSGCTTWGEQLAHLHHRGLGGSEAANEPSNAIWACQQHHDLLDGRTHAGLRVEIVALLRQILEYRQHIGRLLKEERA